MGLKKSVRVALSLGLLLYFAAITLSIDLFHHHTAEPVCHEKGQRAACTHKSHIAQDASCWVCAAHFSREAVQPDAYLTLRAEAPFIRILTENKIAGFVCEKLVLSLRGPPAE